MTTDPRRMHPDHWWRIKDLFAGALEQAPASRGAYLDEHCGDDAELRAEVESLLAAHEESADFIDTPAAQRSLGIEPAENQPSWIGRRVGAYRIVEEVGRGGMSEVYKAVRDDDQYSKEVAVKVLRRGYDIDALLRRFRVETQILATLDHPNIARLLDAGSTEDGWPYLVMDFIKGSSIDEYCRRHDLPIATRLELFRTLCAAVHYVHQHLMVHGDLKCSNVLVTEDGSVKLLDFGIARLLNPAPSGAADPRLTGLVALTPEYASPEQVRGEPITTASDVYSLGVILYRLLTGVLPHRPASGFAYELATQICEREPARPSESVEPGAASNVAALRRRLRGDLDNITLMALRKAPAHRYSSAEQLAEDIRRHLQGFPVMARGASVGYLARKFIVRHKAAVAAAAVFVLSLIAGIVATSWQAHIALTQRARAERHFNDVRKLADTFMFDVHSAIENLPGATPARHLLVDTSLKYLDALSRESGEDPSLRRDLASAYEKVGDVQGKFRSANLGDAQGSIGSYQKALAIRKALVAEDPTNADLRRELLRNHGKLSELALSNGDPQAAIEHSRASVSLARELARTSRASVVDQRNLANAYVTLGWQQVQTGEVDQGLSSMSTAAAMFEALAHAHRADVRSRRNLALTLARLGEALADFSHKYEEALTLYERARAIIEDLMEAGPDNVDLQKMQAYVSLGVGECLFMQNSASAALSVQQPAVRILSALHSADPQNDEARFDAAYGLGAISDVLIALGDAQAAVKNLEEALELMDSLPAPAGSRLTRTDVLVATLQLRMGRAHAAMASGPDIVAGHRIQLWQAARSWSERSVPVLAAAERDMLWRAEAAGRVEEARRRMAESDAALAALRVGAQPRSRPRNQAPARAFYNQ